MAHSFKRQIVTRASRYTSRYDFSSSGQWIAPRKEMSLVACKCLCITSCRGCRHSLFLPPHHDAVTNTGSLLHFLSYFLCLAYLLLLGLLSNDGRHQPGQKLHRAARDHRSLQKTRLQLCRRLVGLSESWTYCTCCHMGSIASLLTWQQHNG